MLAFQYPLEVCLTSDLISSVRHNAKLIVELQGFPYSQECPWLKTAELLHLCSLSGIVYITVLFTKASDGHSAPTFMRAVEIQCCQ